MKATTALAIGVGVVGLIALTGTASAATQQPPATPGGRKRRRKELPANSERLLLPSSSSSSSADHHDGGSSSSESLAEQAEDLTMVEVPFADAPAAPAARRDVPEEGKPLAWDPKEHPLAANQRKPRRSKPSKPKAGTAAAAVPAAPAKPASPAASTHKAVTAPKQPASPKRTAEQAANELYRYVVAAAETGTMGALGTKGKPNAVVRDAQADMGGLATDGIYGPATRTRGKKLIGKTFPARK